MKSFYVTLAIIGTVVPWYFFGSFFAANGLDITGFVLSLFDQPAAAGFTADVLISIAVFLIWSFVDAKENQVNKWWLVLPATLSVGLSLSLPLYLYLREETKNR